MAINSYIEIQVNSSKAQGSVNKLDKSMTGLGRTSDGVVKSMFTLSRAAIAVSSALSASVVVKYADAFKSLQNQLRLVTGSYDELNQRTSDLLSLSNRSRASINDTATLYAQLTLATEDLGMTTGEQLRITETISKAFAVTGATAQESAGAIRQLGQALSAGALRGDEYNSVAEQAPEIMRALKRETGLTAGELRAFAATGGITAELLVTALGGAADVIDSKMTKAVQTFGQSSAIADNNFTILIGSVDDAVGFTQALGVSMVDTSERALAMRDNIILLIDSVRSIGAVWESTARSVANSLSPLGEQYNNEMSGIVAATDATVDFLINAFKNVAPNIKAAIQIAVIELVDLLDSVRFKIAEFNADTAFISEAVGGLTQKNADAVLANIIAEIKSKQEVKAQIIDGILEERETNTESFNIKMKQIEDERSARLNDGQSSGGGGALVPAVESAESSPFISRLKAETEALRFEMGLRKSIDDGFFTEKQAADIERLNNTLTAQQATFDAEMLKIEENEIAKAELLTQFREANIAAVEDYAMRAAEVESNAAIDRAKTEEDYSNTVLAMKMGVASQAAGLLRALVGDSKIAAIALIAIEKGLAIGQAIINSQVAATRALAELGPILGPPAAAAMISYGQVSAGLIAATGIAQAASIGSSKTPSFSTSAVSSGRSSAASSLSSPQGPSVATTVIDIRAREGQMLTVEEVRGILGSIDGVTIINSGLERARRLGEI
jgi:tape measure domain-containing protein